MTSLGDFWVFGYGSLMWAPGFEFEEAQLADLGGFHRDLCILSYVFRGTPEVPGLVMGLNPKGRCTGRAFRVRAEFREQTVQYLHEREMINDVYEPSWLNVTLAKGEKVSAYTFVARQNHPQYVGHYSLDQKVKLVLQGVGRGGTSLEYLENTIQHLQELSICDETLEAILAAAVAEKV